jgi:hypothetical protein
MIATLLLCTLLAPNDGPADSILVRYDLTGVLPSYDQAQIRESLLMSAGTSQEHHRTPLEELTARPDADSIVELLARLFTEEFEYEGRELALQGDRDLLVLAPDDVQQRVSRALQELEQTLGASVELQIDVLSLQGDGPAPFGGKCVVDEGQLASLPASGRPSEQYRVRLQAGRTAAIDRTRVLPLVVDYDVEIAQGAVIHDPVIGAAEAGTRMLLRGAPMSGGGVALSVFFTHGDPTTEEPMTIEAPLRSFVSTDPDQTDRMIDAPRVEERYEIAFQSASFDTLLPAGKALVLSAGMKIVAGGGDPGARTRTLVVIRRIGGEMPRMHRFSPQGSRRELVFVNAESLQVPVMFVEGLIHDVDDDYGADIPQIVATVRSEPSEFLVDWVDSRFSTWRLVGPWLVCVYDASWDGDAIVRLDTLVNGWQDRARLLDVALDANARGEQVASWRLPVRAGTRMSALVGISTSTLYDYDVEVAGGAAAADPRLRPQFAGLALIARTADLVGGGAALDLSLGLQHRRAAPKLTTLGGPLMTKIERTPFDVLRLDERVTFAPGLSAAAQMLGDRSGSANVDVSVR